jgi:hypothetical protein
VQIKTQLVADRLESAAASAFLEALPTPAQLMSGLMVEEIQKQLVQEKR